MSRNYKFHNPAGIYFVSFALIDWIDLFVRTEYTKILLDEIRRCQKEAGLNLHGFVIMPSHVHLVFSAENEDPGKLLRMIKMNSSKKLRKAIQNHPKESRKEWILERMWNCGQRKSNVKHYQLWQQNNHPII